MYFSVNKCSKEQDFFHLVCALGISSFKFVLSIMKWADIKIAGCLTLATILYLYLNWQINH